MNMVARETLVSTNVCRSAPTDPGSLDVVTLKSHSNANRSTARFRIDGFIVTSTDCDGLHNGHDHYLSALRPNYQL